jgi:exopolysaccharide production protein ExoZ
MATLSRIESARGAAALAVLLYHASASTNNYYHRQPWKGAFLFGHSGVYFFFVLSGFIIFFAHRNDIGQKKALRPYLLKRFIRIFPPYWVVFPPVAVLYFLARSTSTVGSFTPVNLLSEFLLSPFGNQLHGIMYVAWTLHLEVLFYLVFACLIVNRTLGLVTIGLWLMLIVGDYSGLFAAPTLLWRAAQSGNLGFLLGMLAVLVLSYRIVIPARLVAMLGLLTFLVGAWLDVARQRPYSPIYLFASFLLVVSLARWDQTAKTQAPKAATAIGAASYSIYLVHYPVISILSKLLVHADGGRRLPMEVFFLLIAIAALLVSLMFYRLVEKPILTVLRRRLIPSRSQRTLLSKAKAVV